MEAAGAQDNGQVQPLMDQSRTRNADIDGIVDDGGGGGGVGVGGGLSDQQRQPINLSQACTRLLGCFVVSGALGAFLCIPPSCRHEQCIDS